MEMEIKFEIIEATNGFIIHYGKMYIVATGGSANVDKFGLRHQLADLITEEMLGDCPAGIYDIKINIEKHD